MAGPGRAGTGRGVPGSPEPDARVPRVERQCAREASRRSGTSRQIAASPKTLSYAGQPVPGERAWSRAAPRRAAPQSPPGPAGEERGAGTPSAGSGRQCAPGLNGGVRGSSDPPAARARLGRPLRATPGAMPPAPRAPRERREHGEVE